MAIPTTINNNNNNNDQRMSISRKFLPLKEGLEVATVAAGCFWGVEHIFRQYFGNGKGLVDCRVGYAGGHSINPTYKQVCTSQTGHAEALQILFDPKVVQYKTLIDFFLRMHDPTTKDRQGNDVGSQYRSVIFYHSDSQRQIAQQVKDHLAKTFYARPIATEIVPIKHFYDAEDYHQLYLDKNPSGYVCESHYLRTTPEK